MRIKACAWMLTLLALVTACGLEGATGKARARVQPPAPERPSVETIAAALDDPDNPIGKALGDARPDSGVIDCIAQVLHDSDLSVEALQALVDGDAAFQGNAADSEAVAQLSDGIARCVTG